MRKSIFIFLFIPLITLGQTRKEVASQNIQNLKNGALIVRLKTAENKINALKKVGREKEAEEAAKKQYLENQEIYTAFKTIYNFSPVYFFYSSSSNNILLEKYKGNLLNEKLEVDTTINVTEQYIYISEFDNTPGTGLSALVIKNKKFELLEKPFPFYVKGYDLFPVFRRHKSDMISIMNGKLHKAS